LIGIYSPSPQYPAAYWSETEIPHGGAAGMNGKVNRAEAHQSEGGLIPLYHFNIGIATSQFRFDTPPLVAGSFISRRIFGSWWFLGQDTLCTCHHCTTDKNSNPCTDAF